ncbi:MAG: hypothetical protein JXA82_12850, partial [Sedimentisphaerales bacterium]|nr:hypothetical protein [Sedimentisphaerales bacterium]
MFRRLRRKADKLLHKLRLKPLSLAEKCRLQFGAAVLLSLVVALLVPYLWMGKLTQKIAIDAGRAVAETVYEHHFRINRRNGQSLPVLMENGVVTDPNQTTIQWIRFDKAKPDSPLPLSKSIATQIRDILDDPDRQEHGWINLDIRPAQNEYIRIVSATDACLTCHNPETSPAPFNRNEAIGAIYISTPAWEYSRT